MIDQKDSSNPSQADKFKKAARELEADESEQCWEENLRKIISPAKEGGVSVGLFLEGNPHRFVDRLNLDKLPSVGDEIALDQRKLEVIGTQDTIKDKGSLFASHEHWVLCRQ